MVAFAKARGLAVTAEATPHHLTLTDTDMTPYDSSFKMKPPLRSRKDVNAVVEGIINGAVEVIATDHAPHPGDEKMQEFCLSWLQPRHSIVSLYCSGFGIKSSVSNWHCFFYKCHRSAHKSFDAREQFP